MGYLLVAIILVILLLIYAYIRQFASKYSLFNKIVLCLTIVIFTISVIMYPKESYNAAFDGLSTWFNIVCPSLLPFFIGSELLINMGIVGFIGELLEPVMRPLFNVPGSGSFPFIMSITSGYPVGSKVVAAIYNNKLCNKSEAQRLLSFCSTSGPLFMIGAVATGIFNISGCGIIIALSHYLGALTVGIIFRFYRYKERTPTVPEAGSIKRAFKNLTEALNKENRPLGLLLSDAVKNSINTLLLVGGLIVLFSVIIRLMVLSGFINIFSYTLGILLFPLGIDPDILTPFASGIFEITIGSKLIAASQSVLNQKILAVCAIISWSGFSIHAQVASMISSTDLKMSVYMLCKALHSVFSCIYAYIIISIWGIPGIPQSFQVFAYNHTLIETNIRWGERLSVYSSRLIFGVLFLLLIGFTNAFFSGFLKKISR